MPKPPHDLDTSTLDDLKRLALSLVEEVGRLKGLPAKPKLTPSGIEKKTERAEVKRRRKLKRRGAAPSLADILRRPTAA